MIKCYASGECGKDFESRPELQERSEVFEKLSDWVSSGVDGYAMLKEYVEALEDAERWSCLNMTMFTGETLLMMLCRRSSSLIYTQVLRDLIGWGAEYMVACDSGKTFLRDLLTRSLPNGQVPREVLSTLRMLASTLPAHELVTLIQSPCALNFTAFDYLEHEKFDAVRERILDEWAEVAIRGFQQDPVMMKALVKPSKVVSSDAKDAEDRMSRPCDVDSSYSNSACDTSDSDAEQAQSSPPSATDVIQRLEQLEERNQHQQTPTTTPNSCSCVIC